MSDYDQEQLTKALTEWASNHAPRSIVSVGPSPDEVGRSLKAIKDGRLYREEFSNFYVYCARRFGLTPESVDSYIASANGHKPEPKPVAPKQVEAPASVVYFISSGSLIKIGVTVELRKRFTSLQCGSPMPLTLLASIPGDRSMEQKLHKQFSHLRTHGEWFKNDPSLMAYIESLQSQGKDNGSA